MRVPITPELKKGFHGSSTTKRFYDGEGVFDQFGRELPCSISSQYDTYRERYQVYMDAIPDEFHEWLLIDEGQGDA